MKFPWSTGFDWILLLQKVTDFISYKNNYYFKNELLFYNYFKQFKMYLYLQRGMIDSNGSVNCNLQISQNKLKTQIQTQTNEWFPPIMIEYPNNQSILNKFSKYEYLTMPLNMQYIDCGLLIIDSNDSLNDNIMAINDRYAPIYQFILNAANIFNDQISIPTIDINSDSIYYNSQNNNDANSDSNSNSNSNNGKKKKEIQKRSLLQTNEISEIDSVLIQQFNVLDSIDCENQDALGFVMPLYIPISDLNEIIKKLRNTNYNNSNTLHSVYIPQCSYDIIGLYLCACVSMCACLL